MTLAREHTSFSCESLHPPTTQALNLAIGMSTQEIPKGDLLPHSHHSFPLTNAARHTHNAHRAHDLHNTAREPAPPHNTHNNTIMGMASQETPKGALLPHSQVHHGARDRRNTAREPTPPHNTNTNKTMGMASQGTPKGAPLPHSQMHHCSTHPISITYPSPDGLADQKGFEELVERGGEGGAHTLLPYPQTNQTHTPNLLCPVAQAKPYQNLTKIFILHTDPIPKKTAVQKQKQADQKAARKLSKAKETEVLLMSSGSDKASPPRSTTPNRTPRPTPAKKHKVTNLSASSYNKVLQDQFAGSIDALSVNSPMQPDTPPPSPVPSSSKPLPPWGRGRGGPSPPQPATTSTTTSTAFWAQSAPPPANPIPASNNPGPLISNPTTAKPPPFSNPISEELGDNAEVMAELLAFLGPTVTDTDNSSPLKTT